MAHAFNTISAKPAFGTLKQNISQSDYINRKKGVITFCKSPSTCQKIYPSTSYDRINSFNLGKYTLRLNKCNIIPINKSNLIIGQYTKENLMEVCTIQNLSPYTKPEPCGYDAPCNPCQNNNPIAINTTTDVFYQKYQIDPLGELFGKTQCGELNYTHYIMFNPSSSSLTLSQV